jgi:hypothetical protein
MVQADKYKPKGTEKTKENKKNAQANSNKPHLAV